MKKPAALYGSAAALVAGGLLVAWNSAGDSTSALSATPDAAAQPAAAATTAEAEAARETEALAAAGTLWETQPGNARDAQRTSIQVAAAPLMEALNAPLGTRLPLALSQRFAPLDATVVASSRHEDGTVITQLRVEGSPSGLLTLQENTEAGFFLGQLYYDNGYPVAYEFRHKSDGIEATRRAVSDLVCSELDSDVTVVKNAGLPSAEAAATLKNRKKDGTTANARKLNAKPGSSIGISAIDASVTEGDSGTTNLNFSVRLSQSDRTNTITVAYTTADGTAVAGTDYQAKSGTITFAPKTTSQTVSIPVLGNLVQDGNRTLSLRLSNPVKATLSDGTATGTIVDNDSPPVLSIANTSVTEGNSGTATASVTVTLSKAYSSPVSVNYATANSTATAGSDYTAATGSVTFNPGETTKTVAIAITGDTEVESDETFKVNLSNASGASIGISSGTVTITNDDFNTTSSSSSNVPELNSLPGATAVIYLDMDGQVVSGTQWAGGSTINALGVDTTFTSAQMTEIWKRVSEDYAPFKVNVTTSEAAYLAAPTNRRIRAIITPTNEWYGNYGGVAYVGSFTWTGDTPCWVFSDALSNSTRYIAEAASHEIGHTLGLRHDGCTNPSTGYYTGQGSGEVSWAPIMGVGYYSNLVQWSKGEYANANNLEDDTAIISGTTNGFGYRADSASTTPLTVSGSSASGSGILEVRGDVDTFSFTTNGGSVSLTVNGAAPSQDLDIVAAIYNSSGQLVASANPDTQLNATVAATLPAGSYTLRVSGTGRGSATADGYTDYGTSGQYTVQGTIP
jgi:hypothetical protein